MNIRNTVLNNNNSKDYFDEFWDLLCQKCCLKKRIIMQPTSGFYKVISNRKKTVPDFAIVCNKCLLICKQSENVELFKSTHPCKSVKVRENAVYYSLNDSRVEKLLKSRILNLHDPGQEEFLEMFFDPYFFLKSNHFLTGPPGVGKTYILILLILKFASQMGIATIDTIALTNTAASNLNGKTVYSFYKMWDIKINLNLLDMCKYVNDNPELFDKDSTQYYLDLIVLIIEEISMMSAYILRGLDVFLRTIRNKPLLLFGGVIIIFSGDLLQHPPITTDGLALLYFIQYRPLHSQSLMVFALNVMHRLKDCTEQALMRRLRNGKDSILDADIVYLNKVCGSTCNKEVAIYQFKAMLEYMQSDKSNFVIDKSFIERYGQDIADLYVKNKNISIANFTKRIDEIITNEEAMTNPFFITTFTNECSFMEEKLSEKFPTFAKISNQQTFHADIYCYRNQNFSMYKLYRNETFDHLEVNKFTGELPKTFKYRKQLKLYKGQIVRMLKQDPIYFLVKGEFYIIKEINSDSIDLLHLNANWNDACVIKVTRKCESFEHDGILYIQKQFPLDSAYASTIPTIQGRTLGNSKILFNNGSISLKEGRGNTVAAAMTALSRVEKLSNILPITKLKKDHFQVNKVALIVDQVITGSKVFNEETRIFENSGVESTHYKYNMNIAFLEAYFVKYPSYSLKFLEWYSSGDTIPNTTIRFLN